MKFLSYILVIFILNSCIAGGKLKHKYSGPWAFRAGTDFWIFNRNNTFIKNSESRDHVKTDKFYWGTWSLHRDTLFIYFEQQQDRAIENSSKIPFKKNDTLFVHFKKVYEGKSSNNSYNWSIERHH